MFLNCFDVLISKIIFLKKTYIILARLFVLARVFFDLGSIRFFQF